MCLWTVVKDARNDIQKSSSTTTLTVDILDYIICLWLEWRGVTTEGTTKNSAGA